MNAGTKLEQREIDVAFIPILCSAPLILAHAQGIFEKHGLHVNLRSSPGWSGIKELMAHEKIVAAHMLSPMPLACNLGIDGKKSEIKLAAIQNTNGQALTLAVKHLGIEHVHDMRGFTFGVPYRFSMHYYLLCHYLAEHGLNPLADVTIKEVAPPNMPYYLEQGWVDGIFAPEPFNQIPVSSNTGFIHVLSKDLWPGHPCCSFATTRSFAESNPNTYRALLRAILEAELLLHRADADERRAIARSISDPAHLDLDDSEPAEQVLSGEFSDGKGGLHQVRDRIDFVPFPHVDHGTWMLSQMQRWGQLGARVDHQEIVESTFEGDGVFELATSLGFSTKDTVGTSAAGFDGSAPFDYMAAQPFCSFEEERPKGEPREIPTPVRERIEEINDHLVDAVGGRFDGTFEVTGNDDLGRLEELLGELATNNKFARLALSDRNAKLKRSWDDIERDRRRLLATLDGIDDVIYVASPDDYELLHVNAAFKENWGEDVIGEQCYEILQGRDSPCPFCTNDKIFGEHLGETHVWEFQNEITKRWYRCSDKAILWTDGKMVRFELASDITTLKDTEESLASSKQELEIRNRIAEVFLTVPDEEMYPRILDLVLEALESRYGVFGYIDDEGALIVPTMTRDIWDQCRIEDKTFVFPRSEWGESIWPTALRQKQVLWSNERSKLTPKGHIPVERTIAAPIIHLDSVVGLLQVANKATDYTDRDFTLMETISDMIAPVLFGRLGREREEEARKQAEKDLQEKHRQLVESNELLTSEVAERKRAESELESTAEELREKNWINRGLVRLGEAVAGDLDVENLAAAAISEIAGYLKVQVGTLYATKSSENTGLSLVGSYALRNQRNLPRELAFGEGLVGQAALDKKQILLQEVPDGYLTIGSSLGERPPRYICITPLLHEDRVLGAIEVGTLGELDDQHMAYLTQAAIKLAAAIESAQARGTQTRLLVEAQRLSEELQAQQEELKAVNEELEEQAQRLKTSDERLRVQQEELQVTNEELEEKNELLEHRNREVERARGEIVEKAAEVTRASKYKSEFLANMSHELRTPLNSLLLLSRALRDNKGGNLTADQVESAGVIYESGNDLLVLINEILDLSKIEAGRMDLHFDEVYLADLAASVRSSFRHVAAEKGLELGVSVEESAPGHITSDRQRLEQVIKNLVSNAIKFTDSGSVEVTFARPVLESSGAGQETRLAIAVRDTGIGIPPTQQKLIFEAFRQVDGSVTRKQGGTGLGLSISRELCRLLGAELRLSSEPGEGSTFTILLLERGQEHAVGPRPSQSETQARPPRGRPAQAETSIPDDRERIEKGDRSVLLIEDDPKFAAIMAGQCREQGLMVLAAATGEAGLDLARRFVPRGIVLDLGLPGMDGWRVLELLKEDPDTRHVPVHIVSADEPSVSSIRRGAVGHVQKPVSAEQIGEALAKIEQTASRRTRRVLVVEDDEDVRKGIVELVADDQITVDEATGGGEAIEALASQRYDCMILDLGLRDFGGDELLERIKKDERIEVPPVIVYTARDLTLEEDLQLRSMSDSIIIKDVRSDERLLDEVSLFLHRVVAEMPEKKRQVITSLHDSDALLRGKKVLLVDDDMRTLFALSKILSDHGMHVGKAMHGQKALDVLAQETDFDAVLMDIMMPVLDGYETMRRIRAQSRFEELPIIALTAKAMKDDRERCIEAGANDYLPKPVDQSRLISMLRVWLYR